MGYTAKLKTVGVLLAIVGFGTAYGLAQRIDVNNGWSLRDAALVTATGEAISVPGFKTDGWYAATVPGTVLTSLVKDGIYPEPTYGENSRPESIPESLNKTPYWYRTTVTVPATYVGCHVWLNFEGINFSSEVWVNGAKAGTTRGAFARGIFDITTQVKPGSKATLAVLVSPQPHPGVPHEHTVTDGVGGNGGITALDGPTFLSTIGWDWLPAVRDRDTGIWQRVYLSTTGPVLLKEPLVTTDLPLPKTDSSDIAVKAKLENITDVPQKGVVKGSIGTVVFQKTVELAPHSTQAVSFDAQDTPVLHMKNPRLWWPNGYGPQNLYTLHLSFEQLGRSSDAQDISFGVRKIEYTVADSENLTVSVNGVRVFLRGGNWGLDEAMKRTPRERLEAQIKMHQLANLNLIRNWVGQSTGEDFYELCDKYGILIWDEFFQPNPSDGPNPDDLPVYIANVREKIVRFRNHPSIMLWCARNEGYPPPEIDAALRTLLAELEPTRSYQPSSTAGRGVSSGGPYHWRTPREFFNVDVPFKTEIGSMSIPTIESVHGMMPQKDWESINDDWAQHDFAKGAVEGDKYPGILAARYGKVANLADFVRKGQLMNYEAYRAMYEGREAKLFAPATAVITWMSNPAQPSFVWQLYHYDLEPNASLYGAQKAGEAVHVQWDPLTNEVQVVNTQAVSLLNVFVKATVYSLDGEVLKQQAATVNAAADHATDAVAIEPGAAFQFLKLEMHDRDGKLLSQNFYWQGAVAHEDDLTALNRMPQVTLTPQIVRKDIAGRTTLKVTLRNPTQHIALMTHLQLHTKAGERVLPAYTSENYISLAPGESRTVMIEADTRLLHGEDAVVLVDGWNVNVTPAKIIGASVGLNVDAQVDHWPITDLPLQTKALRQ